MGIKEERERMFSGMSPLRNHSMNQPAIKRSLHGQRTMDYLAGVLDEELPDQPETLHLSVTLPVTQEFGDACLERMLELAMERASIQEDHLTVPQRVSNVLSDVAQVYRCAEEKEVKDVIVERPVADLNFATRMTYLRHEGLISRQNLLIAVTQAPGWRQRNTMRADIFSNFYRAFENNVVSTDFTLKEGELVEDLIETYAYILANLGKLSYVLVDNSWNKLVVNSVLETTKKGLRIKR